jgi:hypothetical protein
MNTPTSENFDTIIKEFNDALFRMGPGIGDPVTRGERALLKTFYMFLMQRESVVETMTDADDTKETQSQK